MISFIKNNLSRIIQNRYWGRIERESNCKILNYINSGDSHRVYYEVTPVHHLKFIARYLRKVTITNEDALFDVGCGEGGMLLYFSQYGFGKVYGLEYSQEVAENCQDNLKKWKSRAHLIVGDAVDHDDYDDFNYFYLYNPFVDVIMNHFIKHLNQSIDRKPRKITILYTCCNHKDLFIENGFKVVSFYKKSIFHTKESAILIRDT